LIFQAIFFPNDAETALAASEAAADFQNAKRGDPPPQNETAPAGNRGGNRDGRIVSHEDARPAYHG